MGLTQDEATQVLRCVSKLQAELPLQKAKLRVRYSVVATCISSLPVEAKGPARGAGPVARRACPSRGRDRVEPPTLSDERFSEATF